MKSQKLVRLLALVLAIVMTAAMFAGCAGNTDNESSTPDSSVADNSESNNDESSTADDGNVAAPSGIPTILKEDPADMFWMHHVDEVVDLEIYVDMMNPDEWSWGSDRVTQYINERVGVNASMRFAADTEGTELNLMLAGGEKLPDIFAHFIPTSTIVGEFIKGEYVVCAEDVINEYAPEFWDIYSPFQKQFATTTDDGKMWGFVNGYEFDENPYGYAHGYIAGREDILEDLGTTSMDIKTLDDFMQVLDDFNAVWKTDYPEVTYPVLMRGVVPALTAVFGQIGSYDNTITYDVENDTLSFWFETEAGKQTLKFYNDLYRKGYLVEEAFISTDSSIDIMGAGKALFYFASNTWQASSANAGLKTNVGEDAWMYPVYPFSAIGEDHLSTFSGITFNGAAAYISADSEHIDRALALLEWAATEEGILTTNMGIYGEQWEVATDDNGNLYPAFIGEVTEEALANGQDIMAANTEAYGVNRYDHGLWLYHTISYNCLWNYDAYTVRSSNPEDLVKARQFWYVETTDNTDLAGVPSMVQVSSSSDAGVAKEALADIYNSELAKLVFVNSDDEFESKYTAMLDALKAAGEDNFWTLYRPLFDEKLAAYKDALATR